MKKITIAIDGHSSCGKSTLSKDLASHLGYVYVDTGAMYRAITLFALENNFIATEVDSIQKEKIIRSLDSIQISFQFNSALKKAETYLNGKNVEEEIRSIEVAKYVSEISTIGEVRKKLVSIQKEFGAKKGVVMEGRDIGSVVLPNADLKFFMTAALDIRAKRRYDELTAKGIVTSLDEIQQNLSKRDYEDTHREDSPLKRAKDAVILDSTSMSCEEQLRYVLQLVKEKTTSL